MSNTALPADRQLLAYARFTAELKTYLGAVNK